MISRLHLTVIIGIAVGSIAITRLVVGESVSWGWFTSIGIAVAVNMVVITAFNHWIWRLRIWQGWFVNRPHLWGQWKVEIFSHWENPETTKRPATISADLLIKQTYIAIHARLQTDESRGDLISARLVESGDGRFRLTGIYRNEPNLDARESSEIHYGAFILDVEGDRNKPISLTGHYWTDRQTTGRMTAVRP